MSFKKRVNLSKEKKKKESTLIPPIEKGNENFDTKVSVVSLFLNIFFRKREMMTKLKIIKKLDRVMI